MSPEVVSNKLGVDIIVPKEPQMVGALGAALLAEIKGKGYIIA
jgi:activator of 2-hydroxyglutaryl-CoA dehydratase